MDYVQRNLPSVKINSISELIGDTTLDLKTVNGTKLPFVGWIGVDFNLQSSRGIPYELKVPFLVCTHAPDLPIIEYNVIEEVVTNFNNNDS